MWKKWASREALTNCQAQSEREVKQDMEEMSEHGALTHCQVQSNEQVKIWKKQASRGGTHKLSNIEWRTSQDTE